MNLRPVIYERMASTHSGMRFGPRKNIRIASVTGLLLFGQIKIWGEIVEHENGYGAVIRRSMVRRRGKALIGHAPMVAQLGWCEAERLRPPL
jgi:hypothetical protein